MRIDCPYVQSIKYNENETIKLHFDIENGKHQPVYIEYFVDNKFVAGIPFTLFNSRIG